MCISGTIFEEETQEWKQLARGFREDRMMDRMGYLIDFKSRNIIRGMDLNIFVLSIYIYIYIFRAK